MKKLVVFVLMMSMFFTSSCGSKEVSQETRDEIKAEVIAELEQERKASEEKGLQEKEIPENKTNENVSEEETKEEIKKETVISKEEVKKSGLKSFEELYTGDLKTAAIYFNENINEFYDQEKLDFAKALVKVVSAESKKYAEYKFEDMPTAYVAMAPTLDSGLYDYYDFETKEFNIAYFKDINEKYYSEFKEIQASPIFDLGTDYWIDNTTIQHFGFIVTMNSDMYKLLKPALELVAKENQGIDLQIPEILYSEVNFDSQITEESILVEDLEELKSFKGQDTWKSTAIMPVIMVEKEIIEDVLKYEFQQCLVKGIEYFDNGQLELNSQNYSDFSEGGFYDAIGIFGTITDAKLSYAVLETDSTKSEMKNYGTLTDVYLEFKQLEKNKIYWLDFTADGKKQSIVLVDESYRNYVKDFAGKALTNRINFSDPTNVEEVVVSSEPKFVVETINGEEINYSDYSAVVVPFYQGINYSEFGPLEELVARLTGNDKHEVSFAVFGTMRNVTITGIENMGEEGTSVHYDEITDSMVRVTCRLMNDMSLVTVTGYVNTPTEEYKVEFTLDDMRDRNAYKTIKY